MSAGKQSFRTWLDIMQCCDAAVWLCSFGSCNSYAYITHCSAFLKERISKIMKSLGVGVPLAFRSDVNLPCGAWLLEVQEGVRFSVACCLN